MYSPFGSLVFFEFQKENQRSYKLFIFNHLQKKTRRAIRPRVASQTGFRSDVSRFFLIIRVYPCIRRSNHVKVVVIDIDDFNFVLIG